MEVKLRGKIIKGVGGNYHIRPDKQGRERLSELKVNFNDALICRARGSFRYSGLTPLIGDDVSVRLDTELMGAEGQKGDGARAGVMIEEILPRKNELIRPPMSNLDMIFVVFSAANPEPALSTVDKLITSAEFKKIEPVIVITKSDLDPEAAEKYAGIYRKCRFSVFVTGKDRDISELEKFIIDNADLTSSFAGASGVGKSTLMNRLFPSMALATGDVSPKTGHGRHTTRHIELFPTSKCVRKDAEGYIADTPGFGMIDFLHFDFYGKDDLVDVFREFRPYIGKCRYTDCSHTTEEDCALLKAVRRGEIPEERHKSYVEFYDVLKKKPNWKKQ